MTIRLNPKRGRPRTPTTALVPAASRVPELLTDEEADLNNQAIATFVKVVGGRDALLDTLSVASTAPEIDRIVTLFLDPRYEAYSLKRLCTLAGLTVADLFAAYKKALITKAHVEATQIIASKLPPIVTDVMDRALTEPTVERQKLALELGQLTEKRGGILMQQNTIAAAAAFSASGGSGALEQLQQAVGDLLFTPTRRTVNETPIGDPPEGHHSLIDPEPEPDDTDTDADDEDEDEDADP